MAAKFRVVEDPRKGRAAIATTRLPAGSQLLSAEAFAAVSLTACNWCFTALSVRRCSGCQLIHYCSRPCQQLDWTRGGHGKECAGAWKWIPRERASQTVLLVARVAAKLLLGDPVDGGDDAVLDLRHHYEDHAVEKLRDFQEMTQLVVLMLSRSKLNTPASDYDTLHARHAQTIVELFCRVNCNAFTICDDANGAPVGMGVFPEAALLNHSCEPNCVVSFPSPQRLAIHVVSEVQPGEELTISYVELLESSRKRRRALRDSYFFECTCPRCLDADHAANEDGFLDGFKCRSDACGRDQAGGVVVVDGGNARCKQCGRDADVQALHDGLTSLQQAHQELAAGPSLQQQWRIHQQIWRLVDQQLPCHPRSTRYANAARAMGNFLIDHGDALGAQPALALDFLQKERDAITRWLLPTLALPSRGLLFFQLAKLHLAIQEKNEAERNIREALALLSTAYGSEHRMVHHALAFLHDLSTTH